MGISYSSRVFPVPMQSYEEDWENYIRIPLQTEKSSISSCVSPKNEYGFIPAFYFDKKKQTTIIFSHGNGCDIGGCYNYMQFLSEYLDVNVILYDYVGYGANNDVPSEQGCYDSINSVYTYLIERGVNPKNIVLYGSSIGTGPSVELAYNLSHQTPSIQLKGLILQSPYTSIISVVSEKLASLLFFFDMFRNVDKIHKVNCPTLIFHGTDDEIIPFDHSIKLKQKSRYNIHGVQTSLKGLKGGCHNDLEVNHMQQMLDDIQKFVNKI